MRWRGRAGYIPNTFVGEGTVGMQGMGVRRRKRVAGMAHGGGVSGFELRLAPLGEDSKRYAIESVREIDRHTALEALRTCSLADAVLPESFFTREEKAGGGEASAARPGSRSSDLPRGRS